MKREEREKERVRKIWKKKIDTKRQHTSHNNKKKEVKKRSEGRRKQQRQSLTKIISNGS